MNKPLYPTPSRFFNQKMKTEPVYFTTKETAEYLRRSIGAVHNMVYRKQLPVFKLGGRLLFKKEDIDRWIERNRLKLGYGN
jgi:excisionase family DNA binding protein